MNITDKLYLEWAWRSKTGTPDINNPDDKAILENLFAELGIKEEDTSVNTSELDQKEIQEIINAINSIKNDYVKYLRVFSYFDNNSLGTISEVLLTKLLQKAGIEARHTGASGGLADLYINGKPISLKTTLGTTKIGLGNDQLRLNPTDIEELRKVLIGIDPSTYSTVRDLENILEPNLYKVVTDRIDAIAEKLAGPENKEYFVWVEKIFDKKTKVLTAFKIHVAKYDLGKVKEEMMNMKPYASNTSWGLKDGSSDNAPNAVTADAGSKYLNIEPSFVRKTTGERAINIPLIADIEGIDKVTLSNNISDELLNALDQIHSKIFKV
jgi:hypothetical protein